MSSALSRAFGAAWARTKPSTIRRQAIGATATDDPVEQSCVLTGNLELRIASAHRLARMGESQQVAVAHTVTLTVLHRLVGERIELLRRVPAPDRSTQRAAPAAEVLDEPRELEQMRSSPADRRQRVERRTTSGLVAEARARGQREQRRLVLGRSSHPG